MEEKVILQAGDKVRFTWIGSGLVRCAEIYDVLGVDEQKVIAFIDSITLLYKVSATAVLKMLDFYHTGKRNSLLNPFANLILVTSDEVAK